MRQAQRSFQQIKKVFSYTDFTRKLVVFFVVVLRLWSIGAACIERAFYVKVYCLVYTLVVTNVKNS